MSHVLNLCGDQSSLCRCCLRMRKRGVLCFKPMWFETFVMKMLSKNEETWGHMF